MRKSQKDFIKKFSFWKESDVSFGTLHKLYVYYRYTFGVTMGTVFVNTEYYNKELHKYEKYEKAVIRCEGKTFETLEMAKKHCLNMVKKRIFGFIRMYNDYIEAY